MDGYQLMIPGPVQLAQDVLDEMAHQVVPHYGEDWTAFYNETVAHLKQVFKTTGDVYMIPGSGSAGLEAAIGSSIATGERLLILSNGFFGQRLESIAESYPISTTIMRHPVTEPLCAAELETALTREPDICAVAAVHSESSSGLLNPIRELAEVCRERGVLFIVDAISSLGGIELSMDEWGIGICISASQKCLEGPPGLGIVAVGEDAWQRIASKHTVGWYLNLHVWKEYSNEWADWHPYPITMAVPAVRALRQGIDRILNEGLEARFARHRAIAQHVRHHLSDLGFAPVFEEAVASPTVIAAYGRADLSATDVVRRLGEEKRIKIAGGMAEFKGKIFRIGNMGAQSDRLEMTALLKALASFVEEIANGKE